MPLTIGQKLDAYTLRRVHNTDILEPMARALWWKRWEWRNAAIIEDCGRDPDYADMRANAEHEVKIARAARAKIIRTLWTSRVLNRLVADYADRTPTTSPNVSHLEGAA